MIRITSLSAFLALLEKPAEGGLSSSGLQLNLSYNNIGNGGAIKLAEALSSGRCPSGLQLNFYGNNIGAAGAKLAEALSSGRCPSGLRISLEGNCISEAVLQQINKLLDANEKRHAALSCVAFCQGVRSPRLLVAKVPMAIMDNIFSFVVPPLSKKQMRIFSNKIQQAACPIRSAPDGKPVSIATKKILIAVPAEKENKAVPVSNLLP